MRTLTATLVFILFLSCLLNAQSDPPGDNGNWTKWRGPNLTGVAPTGNPPIEWSESNNIKWKSEIPGIGHATPIIWENQIILSTAIQTDEKVERVESENGQKPRKWMKPTTTDFAHKFAVISVDRTSGEIIWQTTVREELPFSHTHQFGSWASNSAVTDGENIYAYFGSHGLYCLNMNGKVMWERDFGRMEKVMSFGEGSSPSLYKDKLII